VLNPWKERIYPTRHEEMADDQPVMTNIAEINFSGLLPELLTSQSITCI
jgi:hypothetical protein